MFYASILVEKEVNRSWPSECNFFGKYYFNIEILKVIDFFFCTYLMVFCAGLNYI